jgi:hypothetical protein
MKTIAIITLAAMVSGCATTRLEIDRHGIRHSSTPIEDIGLTWRVVATESAKIIIAGFAAFMGAERGSR